MDQKSFDSIYVPGTGLPDSSAVKKKKKKIHLQCRRHRNHGLDPWVRKIPWRKK